MYYVSLLAACDTKVACVNNYDCVHDFSLSLLPRSIFLHKRKRVFGKKKEQKKVKINSRAEMEERGRDDVCVLLSEHVL